MLRGNRAALPGAAVLPIKKEGKLLISHRYNRIPLLDSSPGGVLRELVV